MAVDSISLPPTTISSTAAQPVALAQAEVQQREAPAVTMQPDQLVRQSKPPALDLSGLATGTAYRAKCSTSGISVSGTAKLEKFDGQSLAATLDISFLFFGAKMALTLEKQDNGTYRYSIDRLSGSSRFPEHLGSTLKFVSQKPGQVVLKDGAGIPMTIQSPKGGGLKISYNGSEMLLTP